MSISNKEIGNRIRKMRQSKDLSLTQLADEVGKTSSHLSQIERGLAESSITTLREIAKALDVPMLYFLDDHNKHNTVVRKEERKTLKFAKSHITVDLLSPGLNHQMEMIEASLEPGASTCEPPLPHQGEECTVVIKGKMKIQVGEESYILEEGDSVYYTASIPHKITNIGDGEMVFISAITPPNF